MSEAPHIRRGWKRLAYIATGLLLVGCAYVGVLLPGVPTTPFLLGASFCFVRSSPRLHRWLRHAPIFGRLLHDWEEHRGIRRPVKVLAITMVITVVSCSLIFTTLPLWVKGVIGGLAACGVLTILCVPTVRNPQDKPRV